MARMVTVRSEFIGRGLGKRMTPGVHGVVLALAAAVDRLRTREPVLDARWVELRTAELREGGRSDNVWLRECLRRVSRVELGGESDGDLWGAVLVAEWHIVDAGRVVRVLIPPAAFNALRAPATFAKVEAEALLRLRGAARELYLALADKKKLRQSSWEFDLPELRRVLGVSGCKAYDRWDLFSARVLRPAVAAINDLGVVVVDVELLKDGKPVVGVRFSWRWKSPEEAAETAAQVDRHSSARRKPVDVEPDAPPLVEREREGPSPEARARIAADVAALVKGASRGGDG